MSSSSFVVLKPSHLPCHDAVDAVVFSLVLLDCFSKDSHELSNRVISSPMGTLPGIFKACPLGV